MMVGRTSNLTAKRNNVPPTDLITVLLLCGCFRPVKFCVCSCCSESKSLCIADIDECLEANLAHACGELEQCSNIPGSYYCTCISGYKRIDGACTGEGHSLHFIA